MFRRTRIGFSLLETIVALTLFAGVLLSIIAAGQVVLARMYQNDMRYRSTVYANSIVDSLRGTACARLTSGQGTAGALAASWTVTDIRDVTRVDVTVSMPQRANAPTFAKTIMTLLSCPEP